MTNPMKYIIFVLIVIISIIVTIVLTTTYNINFVILLILINLGIAIYLMTCIPNDDIIIDADENYYISRTEYNHIIDMAIIRYHESNQRSSDAATLSMVSDLSEN